MDDKVRKVNIVITKYYLLAWLYAIVGLLAAWGGWWIPGGICLFFAVSYSVADYRNPPPPIDENKENNDNNGDGPIKPA